MLTRVTPRLRALRLIVRDDEKGGEKNRLKLRFITTVLTELIQDSQPSPAPARPPSRYLGTRARPRKFQSAWCRALQQL